MRNTIAHLIVLTCVTVLSAQAQDASPQPGARLEQLQQRLNLSEDQTAQIRPILVEEAGKLKDIRAKYEGQTSKRSRLKMLRELRDVQQTIEKRIKPILTKQQQAEWKKIREERQEEFRKQRL
jgi:hypothetical protein